MSEIAMIAALLATGLLYVCDGPGLDQVVRQLHTFLPAAGEGGAIILLKRLNEGMFDILCDAVLRLEDCPDNHNLRYVLGQYKLLRDTWAEDAGFAAEPAITDVVLIQQQVELMAEAESEDELAALLRAVSSHILREDGAFVENCVDIAECFLSQWIVKFLTAHSDELDLPLVAQRARDLYDLLQNSRAGDGLALITSHQGKFVPISPKGIDTLDGQGGEDFLNHELSRVADTLPARHFIALLSWLISSATKENAVLNYWRAYFTSLKS